MTCNEGLRCVFQEPFCSRRRGAARGGCQTHPLRQDAPTVRFWGREGCEWVGMAQEGGLRTQGHAPGGKLRRGGILHSRYFSGNAARLDGRPAHKSSRCRCYALFVWGWAEWVRPPPFPPRHAHTHSTTHALCLSRMHAARAQLVNKNEPLQVDMHAPTAGRGGAGQVAGVRRARAVGLGSNSRQHVGQSWVMRTLTSDDFVSARSGSTEPSS